MKKAPIPGNEKDRLKALKRYEILDTELEKAFDDITKIAATICDTQISLICFIDSTRQWFKSHYGLEATETSRDISYCGHAIMEDDIFVVQDATKDKRFLDNPLLLGKPHVKFYAGAPLVTPDGFRIGTLCVIDSESKELSIKQLDCLRALSNNIISLLTHRLNNLELSRTKEILQEVESMSSTGGWELDVTSSNVIWTDEVYRIYGIQVGTPTSKIDGLKNYCEESRAKLEGLLENCIKKGEPFDDAFFFQDNLGVDKWVRSVGRPIYENGEIKKVVGTFQDITRYKVSELKLIEANKYLDLSLDSANLGIWDWDLTNNSVVFDRRWSEMLGLKCNEFEHNLEAWSSRVHPEDLEKAREGLNDLLSGKVKKYRNVHRMRHENGDWIFILDQGVVAKRDSEGNPVRFTGTHSDITLIKKKEQIDKIVETVREYYITLNNDHHSFYEYIFKTVLEVCNSDVGLLSQYKGMKGDSVNFCNHGLENLIEEREKFEYILNNISDCGEYFISNYSEVAETEIQGVQSYIGFPIYKGKKESLIMVMGTNSKDYDLEFCEYIKPLIKVISEMIAYIKLEEYKNEKEYERNIILESTGVALWTLYPQEKRIDWDNSMYVLWEFSKGDYDSEIHAWQSLIHPDDKETAINEFIDTLKYRDKYETSFRIITKSGKVKSIKAIADVVRDADGRATKILGVNWDSTKDVLIQKELIRSKEKAEISDKAKSTFLANMSHEIRTPMNGILGMISLLADSELNKEQLDMIDTIQSSSDILMTILNDILDLSKIDAGKFDLELKNFDIKDCISSTIFLFSTITSEKGVDLTCVIDDSVPNYLNGDVTRIRQILINLLSNAVKFTSRGSIRVEAKASSISDMKINLCISVIDTGIGIKDEVKSKMFEAFSQADSSTTRQYGGTGLGLSICSRFVELMNGSIKFDSKYKEGTTFTFCIPLAIGQDNETIHLEKIAKKKGNNNFSTEYPHKILLVEDNIVNQKIASMMLGKLGYACEIANNGQEGITLIEEASADPFTLVLMDMQMPIMDGLTATKKIIETYRDKSPPIVAMTANVLDEDRQKCFDTGMVDYVSKPIKIDELKRILILFS